MTQPLELPLAVEAIKSHAQVSFPILDSALTTLLFQIDGIFNSGFMEKGGNLPEFWHFCRIISFLPMTFYSWSKKENLNKL
jgi:hypothetical protein